MPSKVRAKTIEPKAKTITKPKATASGLSVALYGIDGKKKGTVALPKAIFGAKINDALMLQAIRVYMINQRQGTANTKTRGEVRGSTRKIYRQKGTGRARHGGITAPIFVGGGIAMGPRSRQFELKLSKQMRKKALLSAFSEKVKEGKISAVDTKALSGKTKEAFKMFKSMTTFKKRNADDVLFVTSVQNAIKASKNIDGVNVVVPHVVNIYDVVNCNHLVFGKDAITKMEELLLGDKN